MGDRMEGDVGGRADDRSRSGPHTAGTGPPSPHAERLASARRRAGAAKGLFGAAAALVFAAAAILARQSYAGHPKGPAAQLGPPSRFIDVVRQDQLQGGVVGPPQAPPDATTSVS